MTVRAVAPHGRRYDVSAVCRARELREAGWQLGRITELLRDELGVTVARSTVHNWVDESQREKSIVRSKRGHRLGRTAFLSGMLGARHHTREFQEVRARALVESGMTKANIARVMDFDYPGQGWSRHRVDLLLGSARGRLAA